MGQANIEITYFRGDMLFNSAIQYLISSSYVA